MIEYFKNSIEESCAVKKESFDINKEKLIQAVEEIYRAFSSGKKLILFGNGGSAADAQHIAAEFVVRLKEKREAYPAIALTTDTSVLTACGNDFGFEKIFQRQVEAMGEKGDVAVAISTSGDSANVIAGMEAAKKKGMKIIGLTGEDGGKMKKGCDILIEAGSKKSMRVQETHIAFLHIMCDVVEGRLLGDKDA